MSSQLIVFPFSMNMAFAVCKVLHSIRISLIKQHAIPAIRCFSNDIRGDVKSPIKDSTGDAVDPNHTSLSGLDKAFNMFQRVESGSTEGSSDLSASHKPVSFTGLLRRSKLMHIGDPEGRVVIGTIVETLDDDLYIDFGGKFDCVCKKPRTGSENYRRGAKVRIRLHDLEMSSRFLGAERDITLLEADATLIGLHRETGSSRRTKTDSRQ